MTKNLVRVRKSVMKGGKMNAKLKQVKADLNEILREEYLNRKKELEEYLANLGNGK